MLKRRGPETDPWRTPWFMCICQSTGTLLLAWIIAKFCTLVKGSCTLYVLYSIEPPMGRQKNMSLSVLTAVVRRMYITMLTLAWLFWGRQRSAGFSKCWLVSVGNKGRCQVSGWQRVVGASSASWVTSSSLALQPRQQWQTQWFFATTFLVVFF